DLLPDAHRRDAVGDRVRQRAHPQEPPRRPGGQRLRPRAEVARRRTYQAGGARARRHTALPRARVVLCQATLHLRQAHSEPARDPPAPPPPPLSPPPPPPPRLP